MRGYIATSYFYKNSSSVRQRYIQSLIDVSGRKDILSNRLMFRGMFDSLLQTLRSGLIQKHHEKICLLLFFFFGKTIQSLLLSPYKGLACISLKFQKACSQGGSCCGNPSVSGHQGTHRLMLGEVRLYPHRHGLGSVPPSVP